MNTREQLRQIRALLESEIIDKSNAREEAIAKAKEGSNLTEDEQIEEAKERR